MPASARAPSRIPELDGLRGLAISLVLWHHLVENFLPPGRGSWLGWLRAATNLSWCGVDLFFVLSGFFIGGILLDQRASPRLVRVFYLRRALRILPLYFVTLAVAISCAILGAPGAGHLFSVWVYATFLTNFYLAQHAAWDWLPLSVLWSIAVEEQFYLTAPWIVRMLRPPLLPRLALGLVCVAPLLRVVSLTLYPGYPLAIHVLMPMRMDALALGALVAWALRAQQMHNFWLHLSKFWPCWLGLGVTLVAGLVLLQTKEGSWIMATLGYTLLALLCALIVAVVAGVRPALISLLAWRPLTLLGRHSYFLYLWHGLLGLGLVRWWGGPHFLLNSPAAGLIVIGAVASTWLAAALSWRFFEGPLIRWGQRHAY